MAAPINVFRSAFISVSDTAIAYDGASTEIYEAPLNNTAIVLMAQFANTGAEDLTITFSLVDSSDGESQLVSEFAVPVGDAADLLSGKLVLAEGQQLHARKHQAGGAGKITISVLESRNA